MFQDNDRGRTATHEVGHWLNLRHIWGDTLCGDDFVADTEPAEEANFGCPGFPHHDFNACGTGADGEMYMNYMDYVDDDCMKMFTSGQANRMHAALNVSRSGILTSNGCDGPSFADSTWSVLPPGDDLDSLVVLPFDFCFYGDVYNDVYVSSNGIISLGESYTAYTSTGFPTTVRAFIAPFWADADTRFDSQASVWYSLTETSLTVVWYQIGYYNAQYDKRNTFKLIITDGNDPAILDGNVRFEYEDMQWTTGSASGGEEGFGGSPASAGINKGDGTTYFQIGEFNQNNDIYINAYDTSGVHFLDYKTMEFNTCPSNIPPIIFDNYSDTIILYAGDNNEYRFYVLSPEIDQSASSTILMPQNMVIQDNPVGNTCEILVQYAPELSDLGLHEFNIVSSDNGLIQTTYNRFFKVLGPASYVNHEDGLFKFNIYPNPTYDIININNMHGADYYIQVHNTLGQLIFDTKATDRITQIDIRNYSTGVYTISVTEGENRIRKKIVKQ